MNISRTVNEDFNPSTRQERVLEVFKDEHRVNPLRIREVTGMNKQRTNDALNALKNAGWVTRVNRGLYEYVGDPREENE